GAAGASGPRRRRLRQLGRAAPGAGRPAAVLPGGRAGRHPGVPPAAALGGPPVGRPGPAADPAPADGRLAPAAGGAGPGPAGAAAAQDLARGDQGEVVGPLRLAAGLAGPRLADRGLRGGSAAVAADRGAGQRRNPVRAVEPAAGDVVPAGGAAVEEPVARGAGLPADEGGVGAGPLRGAVVARVPPPRLSGDAGVRVPAAGAIAGRGSGTAATPVGDAAGAAPGLAATAAASVPLGVPTLPSDGPAPSTELT